KDLPPLPSDAHRWTAARADAAAVYDLILTAVAAANGDAPRPSVFGGAAKAFAQAKERARKEFDDALGVKVGDVLGGLGDTVVTHAAPSDGVSSLGQVVAVAVRDERKLSRALGPLLRNVAALLGEDNVRFRKRPFHGATIQEVV